MEGFLCYKCGCKLIHMGGNAWVCIICDLPSPSVHLWPSYVYQSHCWNCPGGVDSRHSKKSAALGMGWHCDSCGEDLTGWKIKKGIINQGDSHAVL
jgi:hypothetical protein